MPLPPRPENRSRRSGDASAVPSPPDARRPPSAAPTALHGHESLADARRSTVEALCEGFANDEMDVEEFERRVDRAHRTSDPRVLLELRAGLSTRPLVPDGPDAERLLEASVPPESIPARDVVCALLGGAHRRGSRIAPRTTWVAALLGGVEMDFREARLGPGVTNVHVLALMGGVDIVVPPGTRVECRGAALLGGFDHDDDPQGDPRPGPGDGPVLRIRGVACMGGVAVSVRHVGESARDAKRRRREMRRDGEGIGPARGGKDLGGAHRLPGRDRTGGAR